METKVEYERLIKIEEKYKKDKNIVLRNKYENRVKNIKVKINLDMKTLELRMENLKVYAELYNRALKNNRVLS